jgi:hypothetical protein
MGRIKSNHPGADPTFRQNTHSPLDELANGQAQMKYLASDNKSDEKLQKQKMVKPYKNDVSKLHLLHIGKRQNTNLTTVSSHVD